MTKAIWFDMDGTIANLYGTPNWLECLRNNDPTPYATAQPMVNMQALARRLNNLQRKGYKICVVSWLSKIPNEVFDKAVTEAKKKWLAKHLASVDFDVVDIIPYGTPKGEGREGILFDDEEPNRIQWGKMAFEPNQIFQVLGELA